MKEMYLTVKRDTMYFDGVTLIPKGTRGLVKNIKIKEGRAEFLLEFDGEIGVFMWFKADDIEDCDHI